MEEKDDIIVMLDENGDEEEFEFIDVIEHNGKEYIVLLPMADLVEHEHDADDEDEDEDEDMDEDEDYDDEDEDFEDDDEVVILRVEHENGEEVYVNIEDDDELDEVFEVFKANLADDLDLE